MCFFMSLVPATILMVLGFFVRYAGNKAGGSLEKFGKILSIWVFLVALVPILGSLYLTLNDKCPVTHFINSLG